MSFDSFLLERNLLPLGPVQEQESVPGKLLALERELSIKASASDALEGRLEAVEQAEAARKGEVRRLELEHYRFRKATEAGIAPALLDGYGLADETAIDVKILQFREIVEDAKKTAIREHFASNASKPGPSMPVPTAPPTQKEYEAQFESRYKG